MGHCFTEFIMGLQNNPTSANSSLAAYSSNALCNLIEFSEQRFLRDEFNANSIGGLLSNGNSNSSAMLAAHHQQQQLSQQINQQLNQQLSEQLIQHQQQLQQHHLQQQFQQHLLQNLSPNLSANLQAQHLINNNNANGLQVNSSPGSNCSSPDAISQLSSTIKSEDHSSNHSYLSEIRDNALDKVRLLNPIELALNASVQKQLSAAALSASNKTSLNHLNKSELKFSVRSILSEQESAQQNGTLINSNNQIGLKATNNSSTNSTNSKQSTNFSEKDDNLKSIKVSSSVDSINHSKISKKERIESPNKCIVNKTSESSSSSSSSASSSSSESSSPSLHNNSNTTLNQQQSLKTIERRLTEDNPKINKKEVEQLDYTATLAHYSSLIPNVELELLRNQNLAQLNHSNAYPIKPSAHYAINFLRNSLANALLPNTVNNSLNFHQQTNDTPFSAILNDTHRPINNSTINNNNSTNATPSVQGNPPKTIPTKSTKQTNSSNKQSSVYPSDHLINQQQQQLINQQTNHSPTNRLLHNSSQITTLGYPLSSLAWMSSARGKPRRGMMRRAVFSDAQRQGLEKRFQSTKYISKPDRKRLADELGLKDSQVKIWFQNRRMKWRNSKERELLSHGGTREQTLPTKNNPNPDLTDVGSILTAEKIRNSNLTVHQLKQLKMRNAALMNDEMEADADEIDIEGYSDAESQASNYDEKHADSPMSIESPIMDDEDEENRTTRSNKMNSNTYKQETVKNEKS